MKTKIKLTLSILLTGWLLVGCEETPNVDPVSGGNTTYATVKEFLASRAPKPQRFTRDVSNRFMLKSENGIYYRFKSNAFKNNTGQLVTGQVNIELTEYMNKADMVFSGVTTTSGSALLESGGMFNISVTQNGQTLQIVDEFRVEIPTIDPDPNMMVFEGRTIEDSTGATQIDWFPSKTSSVVRDSNQTDTSWTDTTFDRGYYYTLNLRFLSWCNLDKYWNAPIGSPIRVKVKQADRQTALVHVVIKNINGAVYLRYNQAIQEFNSSKYNLPDGWDITIIVLYVDRVKKQLEYAWIDSKTETNHYVEVDELKIISEADLEALILTLK